MNTENEIYKAAHTAAEASLTVCESDLAQEKFRSQAFEQAGGKEQDYNLFKSFYVDRRNFLRRLNNRKSPSAIAAEKQAKTEAAATK